MSVPRTKLLRQWVCRNFSSVGLEQLQQVGKHVRDDLFTPGEGLAKRF